MGKLIESIEKDHIQLIDQEDSESKVSFRKNKIDSKAKVAAIKKTQ